MTHPVFKDPLLQAEFNDKGYVVLNLLSDKEVNALSAIYEKYFPDKSSPFYISTFHSDFETRRNISVLTQQVIASHVNELFVNYKFVVSVFALKRANNPSHFELHQDITVTDENLYTGVSVWCPLQDVDESNGGLYIVPRSHLTPSAPRGMNLPGAIDNVREYIVRNFAKPVKLNVGQVIIWNHRLMHGSYPNQQNADRVAAVFLLIPQVAPVLLYYGTAPTASDIYAAEVLKLEDGAYDYFDVKTKPVFGTSTLRHENILIEMLDTPKIDMIANKLGFTS